jgi:uncharacterized protein (DUF342 family)
MTKDVFDFLLFIALFVAVYELFKWLVNPLLNSFYPGKKQASKSERLLENMQSTIDAVYDVLADIKRDVAHLGADFKALGSRMTKAELESHKNTIKLATLDIQEEFERAQASKAVKTENDPLGR